MRQPAAIEARGIGKSYRSVTALTAVDLTIPSGVIYGVLGPSGAGKTTLVKCLGLVARPTTGSLKIFGTAASGRPPTLRARIGYMPQEPALYEELSARSNVEFFGRGASPSSVDRLFDLLSLSARAAEPVRTFSGGMKQRVSLACTLVRDPELLLLDEPTAGIDPILRVAFWQEFRRLRDTGKTLLVSTHQIDEAAHCDRLLIIRDGRVLIECTPAELSARGGATVSLRKNDGDEIERRLDDPAHELPTWLAAQALNSTASISLHYDSLEDILIRLIRERGNDGAHA